MKIFYLIVISLFLMSGAYCQSLSRSVISIIGQNYSDEKYTISQTTGESFAGTRFANFRFLTQGFQQPKLIDIRETGSGDLFDAIDVYPNPIDDFSNNELVVSFSINELTDYLVEIYDIQGQMLLKQEFNSMSSQDVRLNLAEFMQGLYIVHVYSSNLRMDRIFKIEKL